MWSSFANRIYFSRLISTEPFLPLFIFIWSDKNFFLPLFISPKLFQPPIQGADDGFVGDLEKASLSLFLDLTLTIFLVFIRFVLLTCTLSDKKDPLAFFLGLLERQLLFFSVNSSFRVQVGRFLVVSSCWCRLICVRSGIKIKLNPQSLRCTIVQCILHLRALLNKLEPPYAPDWQCQLKKEVISGTAWANFSTICQE